MALPVAELLAMLERLAPLALAEAWDNVGLLVEPRPAAASSVERVLFTIDLTEAVVAEAKANRVELIVAYHPPIFSGLKRLTQSTANERVVTRLLVDGIFVYSPHTALDCSENGINDWLAQAFGPASIQPIVPSSEGSPTGAGRLLRLDQALDLDQAVRRLKAHLGLQHLRVARSAAAKPVIEAVAVCAGAGGSVLARAEGVDLWVTGELRHHDILARVENGTHVIVSDHTNSERGYLPVLKERFEAAVKRGVKCLVSEVDDDPLTVS